MDIGEFKDSWPPKRERKLRERRSERERKKRIKKFCVIAYPSFEYTQVYLYKP